MIPDQKYREFTYKKERNVCRTTRSQIKSKGNSLIKKKERYAVPHGGQIDLYGNSSLKFARKEKEKGKKKERKKERKEERKKSKKEKKSLL